MFILLPVHDPFQLPSVIFTNQKWLSSLPKGQLFLVGNPVEASDGDQIQPPVLQAPHGILPMEVDPCGGQAA